MNQNDDFTEAISGPNRRSKIRAFLAQCDRIGVEAAKDQYGQWMFVADKRRHGR